MSPSESRSRPRSRHLLPRRAPRRPRLLPPLPLRLLPLLLAPLLLVPPGVLAAQALSPRPHDVPSAAAITADAARIGAAGAAAEAAVEAAGEDAEAIVRGVVRAGESGAPLAGATVEAVEAGAHTFTDRHGRYRIEVPEGTVTLRVTRIGYRTVTEEVRVGAGERVGVDIALTVQSIELEPLVVLLDRTRMVGDPLRAGHIAGSAQVLDRHDLDAQPLLFDNVHTVLRQLPGVNVQDEEGYGLRPNIGLRGTGVERSSKITLMEDGVLIAPAPYAAPAAYYFPVVGRMEAVEVRKGSSQVRYGPRTVGGAVNLVSSSIPERTSWSLDVSGGENATGKVRGRIGGQSENVGWLLETYQIRTDGFKQLDGGGNTGFRIQDYVGKLRVNTDRDAAIYQELELKLGYTDEVSNETYLGLSDTDFRQSPFLRYAASAEDVMNAEHDQIQLRHFIRPGDRFDVTTTLYRNGFARNWYKLGSVAGTGISTVLEQPELYAAELDILKGADSDPGALSVRANNREYVSRGVQSVLGARLDGGRAAHNVELGLRLHADEEDRFQFDDGYQMVGGRMVRSSAGAPGSQDNRVGEARALAVYLQDEIRIGAWTLTPGIRWESIDFTRTDYATDDPERAAPTGVRTNSVTAWVPGVGATLELSPSTHLFGGVHRGFAPPGPGADELTSPEESVNYELGTRLRHRGFAAQAAAFVNDYRNILGRATLATGETGAGDTFNGGAVLASGLEVAVEYDPAWSRPLPVRLPMRLAWTWTRAEFRTDFESDYGPWGGVERGDRLPYLPENQLSGSVGAEAERWKLTLSAFGSSPMRTVAGQGAFLSGQSTDGFVIFNLAAEHEVARGGVLYAGIQNLGDARYIVARRPAGARPGLPRTLQAGFRIRH